MTSNADDDWPAQRRAAAQAHEQRLAQRQASETARARELITAFMLRVQTAGIPAERLVAKNLNGNGTLRTKHLGWYIRANHSAAIGVDGNFYLLMADGGFLARLRGAELLPSDPPLTLGASGRDGESIALREALARVAPE